MAIDLNLLHVVAVPLGLVVLDAVEGVALAIKTHTFSVQRLPAVVENALAPLGLGLGVGVLIQASFAGNVADGISGVVTGLAGWVAARALADVKAKAAALFA